MPPHHISEVNDGFRNGCMDGYSIEISKGCCDGPIGVTLMSSIEMTVLMDFFPDFVNGWFVGIWVGCKDGYRDGCLVWCQCLCCWMLNFECWMLNEYGLYFHVALWREVLMLKWDNWWIVQLLLLPFLLLNAYSAQISLSESNVGAMDKAASIIILCKSLVNADKKVFFEFSNLQPPFSASTHYS